jgi:hypothetical protein
VNRSASAYGVPTPRAVVVGAARRVAVWTLRHDVVSRARSQSRISQPAGGGCRRQATKQGASAGGRPQSHLRYAAATTVSFRSPC